MLPSVFSLFPLIDVRIIALITCLFGGPWANTPGGITGVLLDPAKEYLHASGNSGRRAGENAGKFRSVKDYGAKGDGITDDTQALSRAVASGESLYFPPGTYLLNNPLRMTDNQQLMGAGWNSILSIQHHDSSAIRVSGKKNIGIQQLKIVGNGRRQVEGIRLTDCQHATISAVWITNLGAMNTAEVKKDGDFGAAGILLNSLADDCAWITIDRCRIDHIAGGGNIKGDGIEIGDYDARPSTVHDITILNCRVSTVGRHCYTVGGDKAKKPYNILIKNCYGEKSALDWLDVEDAQSVRVVNGTARLCGNDQTYFNPAGEYGKGYALLAALAVGNATERFEVSGFSADSCYAGYMFGGTRVVVMDRVTISHSVLADYFLGLANHPTTITIRNSAFLTPGKTSVFYFDGTGSKTPKRFSNVTFASPVRLSESINAQFAGCEFRAGLYFAGPKVKDVRVDKCRYIQPVDGEP